MRERIILAAFAVLNFFFGRPINWFIDWLDRNFEGWGD